MHTRCFHYFRKTGSPSYNFFVVKNFQKCYLPDFKFYLGKTNNKKKSPYGVMLNLSLFSQQKQFTKKAEEKDPELTLKLFKF